MVGRSDLNGVMDNFDDETQKILLQIFVDFPTNPGATDPWLPTVLNQ